MNFQVHHFQENVWFLVCAYFSEGCKFTCMGPLSIQCALMGLNMKPLVCDIMVIPNYGKLCFTLIFCLSVFAYIINICRISVSPLYLNCSFPFYYINNLMNDWSWEYDDASLLLLCSGQPKKLYSCHVETLYVAVYLGRSIHLGNKNYRSLY